MQQRVSAASVALGNRPHALYRFFDRTDVLLYVGITMDLGARLKKHRRDKPWWLDIDHITIEHFSSRAEALAAEAEAIRMEGPLHNDQHNEMVSVDVPEPGGPGAAPCGEDCDERCLSHHNDDWWQGRDQLAIDILERVRGVLGDDEHILAAAIEAAHDRALTDDERAFPGEDNDVVIVAALTAQEIADDLARWRFVAQQTLREIPEDIRLRAESEAREDWRKSCEPEPTRADLLPHIIRHLGRVVRNATPPVGA